MRLPSPLLRFLVALLLLVAPASATWSIVIVDLATGEVAIAIATCLELFDLRRATIIVVPGYGVAAAQGSGQLLSLRETIRAGLLAGLPASQIVAQLAASDPSHQSKQYGINSLVGGCVSQTGLMTGAFSGGLTGQVGSLVYAIQGNLLTGQPVLSAAQTALQTTAGTLGDRLMAAMEAAALFGGDGRCSCHPNTPTACGSPPPTFTKSAHTAMMILSRPSDPDAPCTQTLGCGAGQYWLDLNVGAQPSAAPDPVVQLRARYNTWKAQQVGRPDHFRSTTVLSSPTLRADGQSVVTGTVWLRDAAGQALGNSLPVTVVQAPGSAVAGLQIGPAVAQANGSYTFVVTAGFVPGAAVFDVATNDAFGRIALWPRPALQVNDVFGPCAVGAVPNGAGGIADVLRVQGSAGADRVVDVGYGQPFPITLSAQAGSPQPPSGLFALWAHVGVPPPGLQLPLGPGQGTLCFVPAPLAPSPTLLLADAFAGGGLLPATSAPWTWNVPGVPAVLDVALQGVLVAAQPLQLMATNAVLLRVRPLPPPTIQAVLPPSPLPGQFVTLQGSNFFGGATLQVAGVPVPVVGLLPPALTFVMPAGVPCDAPMVVTNPGGSATTLPISPTPVIQTVPFPSGPQSGGATFVLAGNHLAGCSVTLGGVPLTMLSNSATVIVGLTPPGPPGPSTVVVRSPTGCQTTLLYTYF